MSRSHSEQWLQKAPLFPRHRVAELFMDIQGPLKEEDKGFTFFMHVTVVICCSRREILLSTKALGNHPHMSANKEIHCLHISVGKKNKERVWRRGKVFSF